MQQEEKKIGIIIPQEKLSPTALNGLIEEFILREGTDYGLHEYSVADKTAQIVKQLSLKHILILFDPETESTNLIRKENTKDRDLQNWDVLSES